MTKAVFLTCLAACLALLIASAVLTPVSNDAGTYLTQAAGLLSGKVPYRDAFDHKTPGIYALFAVILAISDRSLATVQLVQTAAVVLTALLMALLTARRWTTLAGALAGLILLYGAVAYAGTHLTTETWVALCTAAALVLVLRPQAKQSPAEWLAAGFLIGLSALFKQTGLLTLAAFGVWAWLTAPHAKNAARRWMLLALGCILPLAVTAALFAAKDALPDLWRDTVWINATAYPRQSLTVLARGNLTNLRSFPVLALALLAGLVFHPPSLRRRGPRQAETLLWLTLASGMLPLLHRYYGHYLLQPLPAAAALAGVGLAAGWQKLARRPAGIRGVIVAAFALLAFIDAPRWPAYLAYTRRLVEEQQQAADLIRTLTDPEDPILAISAAPQYYFLSDRPPASHWLYLYPVNYTPARETELTQMIANHAAKAIAVDDGNPVPWHERLRKAVTSACHLRRQVSETVSVYVCR